MNILFLTLGTYRSLDDGGLYSDLIQNLCNDGHNVYLVCPIERREHQKTELVIDKQCSILRVKTLNIQKTNIIEKGIGTVLLPHQFMRGIKKFYKGIKFDLVLYPTPPITIFKVVKKIKKKYNAKTYLMLKDIFPQNAVDLGMLNKKGIKKPLYQYFRNLEKRLYNISDKIGCMSNANVDYLLRLNNYIPKEKVELFPNCINPQKHTGLSIEEKNDIRKKYDIPLNKKVFIYGGNLGKPQNIDYVTKCIDECKDVNDAFFLIVGSGTEKEKLVDYIRTNKPSNLKLLGYVPKNEFLDIVSACDVGLIFLDYRFTIPNFPSRFLSYLQVGIPTYACTDSVTDIGRIIVDNNLGWWSPSNDVNLFKENVKKIVNDSTVYKEKCFNYLEENYNCYNLFHKIVG